MKHPSKQKVPRHAFFFFKKGLECFRKNARRLFNKTKRTGDRAQYKASLIEYNKAIRKAKVHDYKKQYLKSMEKE